MKNTSAALVTAHVLFYFALFILPSVGCKYRRRLLSCGFYRQIIRHVIRVIVYAYARTQYDTHTMRYYDYIGCNNETRAASPWTRPVRCDHYAVYFLNRGERAANNYDFIFYLKHVNRRTEVDENRLNGDDHRITGRWFTGRDRNEILFVGFSLCFHRLNIYIYIYYYL